MELKIEAYTAQLKRWPKKGKHILAQYSEEYVVVYQAYRPAIGQYAASNNKFGGDFSFNRMSWIKPNFLWMMYRSGWGTKPGQEVTLAIALKRQFFAEVLKNAFPSSNHLGLNRSEWDQKVANSNVRLQWDPDHDPFGAKQERKAIQLGLRKEFLVPFGGDAIVEILDMSSFVAQQRDRLETLGPNALLTPSEAVFDVDDTTRKTLQMDSPI